MFSMWRWRAIVYDIRTSFWEEADDIADSHVLPCEAIAGAGDDRDVLRLGCFSAVLRGDGPR